MPAARRAGNISLFLLPKKCTLVWLGNLSTFAAPYAGVVKLVDTLDLGSSASRLGGSSPSARTKTRIRFNQSRVKAGLFYNIKNH